MSRARWTPPPSSDRAAQQSVTYAWNGTGYSTSATYLHDAIVSRPDGLKVTYTLSGGVFSTSSRDVTDVLTLDGSGKPVKSFQIRPTFAGDQSPMAKFVTDRVARVRGPSPDQGQGRPGGLHEADAGATRLRGRGVREVGVSNLFLSNDLRETAQLHGGTGIRRQAANQICC